MTEDKKEENSWEAVLFRVIDLIKEDPELHDAVVKLIAARAQYDMEAANYKAALAQRVRERTKRERS